MDNSDEHLVELCKKGDDRAFEMLMERHVRALFSFVRLYAKSKDDAEDIAQDSFFKAWKNIKKFKSGSRFKPWLYAIARNTALDHLRKRKVDVFSELDDTETDATFAETLEDTEPLQHEVFDKVQTANEMTSILQILHPEHRTVMTLHYHEEMSFEEIAIIMKKPMNTVKSWHRRALVKMKDHMHQSGAAKRIKT